MYIKTSNFSKQTQQTASLPLTSINLQQKFFIFSFSKLGINIFQEAPTKINPEVAEA